MESTSTSSKFLFRDHQEMDNSTQSDTGSDEPDLDSMTGKGIKHLCSELLEIKAASDEDFHTNIFANYSPFIRIFEKVESMENELVQLKSQLSTQKRLVKDLDGIYLEVLSKDAIESILNESNCAEPSPLSGLEAHINNVSENLDILLSENRIDEAIAILEMEDENFQRIQFEYNFPSDMLVSYKSAISESRAMLMLQLTLLAENPRITAAELQKALVGLCRLGDSHLATQLLLKYYHSRLATGIHNLQCSKSILHGGYIRELAKFVFSMISQAARSFVMLYGETSPYASELIQWAREETEVFVASFNNYVKSISEISGGLSTAVEAVQFALSFCSLLENQRLVLRPCLIKYIRPCMEQFLQIHIDHYKKVIIIFTATDAWFLGRYLVSGILNEGGSSMVVGKQPEYCLLTNSGRKFVTLLQTITEDVTPLVSLQMEGSILKGLTNLFKEYMVILEGAITCVTNFTEKSGSRTNLAESLPQQVSVLANVSTLEHFLSGTVRSIFRGIGHSNSELTKNHSFGVQQKELDSCILFIQEAVSRLRAQFSQKLIFRMMSLETSSWLTPGTCVDSQDNPSAFCDLMPSVAFQVLFLELANLDKLVEDNVFEADWLMELLRELIEAIFVWISNSKEIWKTTEENLTIHHSDVYNQFTLDLHFLAEIAWYGGYFSNDPMVLTTLLRSAFISAGLDIRDVDDDDGGWAKRAATDAIQRLLEIQRTKLSSSDESSSNFEEEIYGIQSEHASDSVQDEGRSSLEDSTVSSEDLAAIDTSAVASNTGTVILTTEFSPPRGSFDLLEGEDSPAYRSAVNFTDSSGELGDAESDELQCIDETKLPDPLLSGEASEIKVSIEGTNGEPDDAEFVIDKLDGDAEMKLSWTEVAPTEYSIKLLGQDEKFSAKMSASAQMKDCGNNVKEMVERINSRETRGPNEGHGKTDDNIGKQLVD